VQLDQQADASGISVLLYPITSEYDDLNAVSASSQSIGILATTAKMFDHRTLAPLYSAITNGEGFFELTVEKGTYNLAVVKDGFGYQYLTEVEISKNETDLNSLAPENDIMLYADKYLSGLFTEGEYVITAQGQSVVENDVYFFEGTNVHIEAGATIRINPGKSIFFNGQVEIAGTEDKPITFVSNDNIYQTSNRSEVSPFGSIRISDTTTITGDWIDNVVIRQSDTGLGFLGHDVHVRNSIFECQNNCITGSSGGEFEVTNCIFMMSDATDNNAVFAGTYENGSVQQSIFWDFNYGVKFSVVTTCLINKCYFLTGIQSITVEYHSDVTIQYSTVISANTGIRIHQESEYNLKYNNITAPIGIVISGTYSAGVANNNNLFCTLAAIKYFSHYGGDMNAANNFWNTTDTEQIEFLIIDKNDATIEDPSYDRYGYVIFLPFRTSAIANAGI
jgi:hypothetical protein